MKVKQRIKALRLLEKQRENPELIKNIGIEIIIKTRSEKDE